MNCSLHIAHRTTPLALGVALSAVVRASMPDSPTRFVVLLFTDIVDSMGLKPRHGMPAFSAALQQHNDLFEELARERTGMQIVKNTGDGYLALFASVAEAIRFALLFQHGMRNRQGGEFELNARVGINAGEVADIQALGRPDVVAPAADLAGRVMSAAIGGQILLTRSSFDEGQYYLREHPEVSVETPLKLCWLSHGWFLAKGLNQPLELFEVGAEGLAPFLRPSDSEKVKRLPAGQSGANLPAEDSADSERSDFRSEMRKVLVSDFTSAEGVYRGYFGASCSAADSARWNPKGGEVVDSRVAPKLPYYHTYWGYEAVRRIAQDYLPIWAPLTLKAVERHFGSGRWLRVPRDAITESGPQRDPIFGETVRHTARAAELIQLLSPTHRRVSEVAWGLIHEAGELQQPDGGWKQFRDGSEPSSLWSTIYVHRFLSKLMQSDAGGPDEPHSFKIEAVLRLKESERFLAQHWHEKQWAPSLEVPWMEGAVAVLAEVGPFLGEALVNEVCGRLRETITPSGRIAPPFLLASAPSESVQALRLAFGLLSAGRNIAVSDLRYERLVQWLAESIEVKKLTAYDVAFAVAVLRLDATEPDSGTAPQTET